MSAAAAAAYCFFLYPFCFIPHSTQRRNLGERPFTLEWAHDANTQLPRCRVTLIFCSFFFFPFKKIMFVFLFLRVTFLFVVSRSLVVVLIDIPSSSSSSYYYLERISFD